MYEINIPRLNIKIKVNSNDNLLKIMLDNNILIENPCGGRGSCGKCKIKLISGELPSLSPDEKKLLTKEEQASGIRLSCLVYPMSDLIIDIIDQEQNHKVLTGGYTPEFNLNPAIRKKLISIQKPTLENQTPYEELFMKALNADSLDWDVLRHTKMKPGVFTAVYNQDELIGIECGDTLMEQYGIAVDIGTTTVVASLIDLSNGQEIDSEANINAQKNFGLDVLTRITYVQEHGEKGILELQKAIVDSLNDMIEIICKRKKINKERIYEISVAANCTMMHMLLGIDSLSLGKSPYSPVFTSSKNIPATNIGLNSMSVFARVNCLPSVSSYIGADIVAGVYVSKLHETDKKSLFIDIGTNGEIVLSFAGKLVSCSCAAGPALEGMNISSGMRAADGAIEEIKITEEETYIQVIGNGKPLGICGSGILAAIREFVSNGLINKRGNIIKPDSIAADDFRQKYIVFHDNKIGIKISEENSDIIITQGDIRQVQLAKSAILSGFIALVNKMEIKISELDEVIVAGQFGAHLPKESLVGTGILPKDVENNIKYIGNSSKTGAYIYLMSTESRKNMEELAREIDYMELSMAEGYERLFVKCSQFDI